MQSSSSSFTICNLLSQLLNFSCLDSISEETKNIFPNQMMWAEQMFFCPSFYGKLIFPQFFTAKFSTDNFPNYASRTGLLTEIPLLHLNESQTLQIHFISYLSFNPVAVFSICIYSITICGVVQEGKPGGTHGLASTLPPLLIIHPSLEKCLVWCFTASEQPPDERRHLICHWIYCNSFLTYFPATFIAASIALLSYWVYRSKHATCFKPFYWSPLPPYESHVLILSFNNIETLMGGWYHVGAPTFLSLACKNSDNLTPFEHHLQILLSSHSRFLSHKTAF